MDVIQLVEAAQLKKDRQAFQPGDQVRVHVKVIEGEKERTQVFEGTVIRRRGEGARASFTVRRISYGVGVERTFPVHSPRSEEHTSELQSLRHLVCRLLLEKKNKQT